MQFVDIRDAGDPVECALAYCAAGADELAMLDITATIENRPTLLDVVRRTAQAARRNYEVRRLRDGPNKSSAGCAT